MGKDCYHTLSPSIFSAQSNFLELCILLTKHPGTCAVPPAWPLQPPVALRADPQPPRDHKQLENKGKGALQAFSILFPLAYCQRKFHTCFPPKSKPLCCTGIIPYNNINISLELITFGVIVPY